MIANEDPQSTAELSGAKVYMVFSRAYRSIDAYLSARLTSRGLYMSDFAVLEALLHKGALTVAVIAEKVGMGESSIVPGVDRLEALGFVRRRRARSQNRIAITIELTQSGHKLIREVYRNHAGDIERILHPLSTAERIEFYRLSKKVGLHSDGLQLARFRDRQGGLSRSQLRRATMFLAKSSGALASVSDVAAKLDLSPSQFSRAFKTTTGFPPHRWQLNHRIAKAQELMRYGGLSLSQIALATGFTEQSHFTRVFKKVVGVSPGAWQRDNRQ
jgi:AraC-like DNA-binding protein